MIWAAAFLVVIVLAFFLAHKVEKGDFGFYIDHAVAKLGFIVFLLNLLFLIFIAPNLDTRRSPFSGNDCYVEWDGRSNPVVCD